jgi:flagellin-like protein
MELKALLDDRDAVSPVIGVILMVAITVILAAVIGTFVLGLGDQVSQTTPNTQMSFDYTEGEDLEIRHGGGDDLKNSSVALVHDSNRANYNNASDFNDNSSWFVNGSDTISTGNSAVLNETSSGSAEITSGNFNPDEDGVIVVWEPSGSDQSTELGEWEPP